MITRVGVYCAFLSLPLPQYVEFTKQKYAIFNLVHKVQRFFFSRNTIFAYLIMCAFLKLVPNFGIPWHFKSFQHFDDFADTLFRCINLLKVRCRHLFDVIWGTRRRRGASWAPHRPRVARDERHRGSQGHLQACELNSWNEEAYPAGHQWHESWRWRRENR